MTQYKKITIAVLLIFSIVLAIFIINRIVENRELSEIYSQVIVHRYDSIVENAAVSCESEKQFYISESNVYPILIREDWQEISSDLPALQYHTWENLLQTNLQSSDFPSNLHLACEYTLVDLKDGEFESLSSCPIRSFSRIGFNENKSQALLLMSQFCGNTVSGLYLLNKIDGHWIFTDGMEVFTN